MSLINQWLKHYNCIDQDAKLLHWGMELGSMVRNNYSNVRCPNIDISHNEYLCLLSDDALTLPPREDRQHIKFSILTVLRHPIERIGSQALFNQGAVRNEYIKIHQRECGGTATLQSCYPHEHSGCPCIRNATNIAINELHSNENIWKEWISKGGHGFNDANPYVKNYYIKRMGILSIQNLPKYEIDRITSYTDCILTPKTCSYNNSYDILLQISKLKSCDNSENLKTNDIIGLNYAKLLLQKQFDFLILEYFNELKTLHAFQYAIHDLNFIPKDNSFYMKSNGGVMKSNNMKTEYWKLMPDSILTYFQNENKEDIELYEYAVKLFDERALKYGWGNR